MAGRDVKMTNGAGASDALNQLQMQRKRDIKSNYKAKLPVEKLIDERNKKRAALQDLLEKRGTVLRQLTELHARIGIKQSVKNQIDYQFHKRYETFVSTAADGDAQKISDQESSAMRKQEVEPPKVDEE